VRQDLSHILDEEDQLLFGPQLDLGVGLEHALGEQPVYHAAINANVPTQALQRGVDRQIHNTGAVSKDTTRFTRCD
jgi:hypothetical protein